MNSPVLNVPPRTRTPWELLDEYVRDNLLQPASVRADRNVALQLIKDRASPRDDLNLSEIAHELLVAWRTQILERARPNTWNYYRRHLRALLNYAVLKDWLVQSPLRQVKSAPEGSPERRAVSREALIRLLAVLDDDYGQPRLVGNTLYPRWFWRIVVLTLYYTGMRRREMLERHVAEIGVTPYPSLPLAAVRALLLHPRRVESSGRRGSRCARVCSESVMRRWGAVFSLAYWRRPSAAQRGTDRKSGYKCGYRTTVFHDQANINNDIGYL